MSFDDFIEAADFAVIDDAFRRAGRVLSPDLATTYCEALAKSEGDPADLEAALIEARVTIAAIGMVPGVKTYLEDEAEKLANDWLTRFRVEIRGLSDERQEVYRQLREMSAHPLDVDLAEPKSWMSSAPRFPWTRSCGILTPRGESEMKHKKVELVKERGRWSAKSKRDAVLRLLRGEDLDTVSRESKVTAAKLTEWREAFLASGMAGLKARETDARDEEIERLKAVLGEMTMRCELQRDAIRRLKAGLPLDETRLPK